MALERLGALRHPRQIARAQLSVGVAQRAREREPLGLAECLGPRGRGLGRIRRQPPVSQRLGLRQVEAEQIAGLVLANILG
jgi:hypothetical protein